MLSDPPPSSSSSSSSSPVEAALNAQIHRWYEDFRAVTIKTQFIHLPPEFVAWLQADGVILPSTVTLSSTGKETGAEDDAGEGAWRSDGQATDGGAPSFPAVEQALDAAIAALGGFVCPKLNWSVPRDAEWVNGPGGLKCETAGDVLLLLKSSDFVQHDLGHMLPACAGASSTAISRNNGSQQRPSPEPVVLAVRKWANFHRSMHFRCFVRGHRVVAISQREHTIHFPFLAEEVPRLARRILAFFHRSVRGRYPDPDYVMDVYVDKRGRVWLVDFNVFSPAVTDGLLFCWTRDADVLLLQQQPPQGEMQQQENDEEDDWGSEEEEEDDDDAGAQLMVDEEEDAHEGVAGFRITRRVTTSTSRGSSSRPVIFRIVGHSGSGGANGGGVVEGLMGGGGGDGGMAVAPDPLAMYRAPMDLMALGGALDMAELMRRTMEDRRRRGSSSSDSDSDSDSGGDDEDSEGCEGQ